MVTPDRPVSERLEELRAAAHYVVGEWSVVPEGSLSIVRTDRPGLFFEGNSHAAGRTIVAAVNALPALLDIAQAAAAYVEAGELDAYDIDGFRGSTAALRAALERLR